MQSASSLKEISLSGYWKLIAGNKIQEMEGPTKSTNVRDLRNNATSTYNFYFKGRKTVLKVYGAMIN